MENLGESDCSTIDSQSRRILELSEKIEALERENKRLRQSVEQPREASLPQTERVGRGTSSSNNNRLSNAEIERYSRQLLLSNGFGVAGQKKLLSSSVCVVGAGGIGSTVILYLAACGVGHLTVVDFDEVDISNLHRQVIHKTKDIGMNKARSASQAVQDLNPTIHFEKVESPLTSGNALELISKHDCVVDASDNPQTRYLINDACVLAGLPLVSGSAIGVEGQVTVYNFQGGPCYRCLYPKPDVNEGSKSCSDNGVFGPVPGLIGILQAIETVKVLTGMGEVMSQHLSMYDSLRCSFLRIKKPPRQPKCLVCGPNATIKSMVESANVSKEARGPSCSIVNSSTMNSLADGNQITVEGYKEIRQRDESHILLDVRVPEQFDLCSLAGAVNIPLDDLKDRIDEVEELSGGVKPVYCICRRGIASVSATQLLNDVLPEHPKIHSVINIKNGLDEWRREVDKGFPRY